MIRCGVARRRNMRHGGWGPAPLIMSERALRDDRVRTDSLHPRAERARPEWVDNGRPSEEQG